MIDYSEVNKSLVRRWDELLEIYTGDRYLQTEKWSQLSRAYTSCGRYYHDLNHLSSLFHSLDRYRGELQNPNTLSWSIFYHDAIYCPWRKDNEKRSADYLERDLANLGVPENQRRDCYRQILQTKDHRLTLSAGPDDAYLLDFDLEVLGRTWPEYQVYAQQIRREYWMFPTGMYRRGRTKALKHFLARDWIYHTPIFRESKEENARNNLTKEILKMRKG